MKVSKKSDRPYISVEVKEEIKTIANQKQIIISLSIMSIQM